MATYCISDIHGHGREFVALMEVISPTQDDTVYVLGDVIDRGPNVKELLQILVGASEEEDGIFRFLVGNHEHMAYQLLIRSMSDNTDDTEMDHWLNKVDGSQTTQQALLDLDPDWVQEHMMPWFHNLSYAQKIVVGKQPWMLVHAGFEPKHYARRLSDQPGIRMEVGDGFGCQECYDMLWVRETWLFDPADAPLPTVHGHTPTMKFAKPKSLAKLEKKCGEECYLSEGGILYYRNKIDIDAGAAVDGGKLTCLRLDDFEEFSIEVGKY